jgi:hypothetical protein
VRSVLRPESSRCSSQCASSCLPHVAGRWAPRLTGPGGAGCGLAWGWMVCRKRVAEALSPLCPAYSFPHSTGGRHGRCQVRGLAAATAAPLMVTMHCQYCSCIGSCAATTQFVHAAGKQVLVESQWRQFYRCALQRTRNTLEQRPFSQHVVASKNAASSHQQQLRPDPLLLLLSLPQSSARNAAAAIAAFCRSSQEKSRHMHSNIGCTLHRRCL